MIAVIVASIIALGARPYMSQEYGGVDVQRESASNVHAGVPLLRVAIDVEDLVLVPAKVLPHVAVIAGLIAVVPRDLLPNFLRVLHDLSSIGILSHVQHPQQSQRGKIK
jgi:hypothetical protein